MVGGKPDVRDGWKVDDGKSMPLADGDGKEMSMEKSLMEGWKPEGEPSVVVCNGSCRWLLPAPGRECAGIWQPVPVLGWAQWSQLATLRGRDEQQRSTSTRYISPYRSNLHPLWHCQILSPLISVVLLSLWPSRNLIHRPLAHCETVPRQHQWPVTTLPHARHRRHS